MIHLPGRTVARLAAKVGWFPYLRVRSGVGRGLKISLRNASADYVGGMNELPVQRAIEGHLAPGGVFYDVGSNIGFFALAAARLVKPAGRVYAFEPVPANAQCIRANSRRNRLENLSVLPVAVGAQQGHARLFLSTHPGGATIAGRATSPEVVGTVDVATVAVDDLVESGELAPPTLVKVDVEGAELEALEGMRRTIGKWRPALIVELDDATADGLDAKLGDLHKVLDGVGYAATTLEPSYQSVPWHVVHLLALPAGAEGQRGDGSTDPQR